MKALKWANFRSMLGSAMAKNTMRLTFGESRLICPNAERFMCSTLPTSSMKISSGFRASAVSDNEKTRSSPPCFDDSQHFCRDRLELFKSHLNLLSTHHS